MSDNQAKSYDRKIRDSGGREGVSTKYRDARKGQSWILVGAERQLADVTWPWAHARRVADVISGRCRDVTVCASLFPVVQACFCSRRRVVNKIKTGRRERPLQYADKQHYKETFPQGVTRKTYLQVVAITSTNINRFSKFFCRWKCSKCPTRSTWCFRHILVAFLH